MYRNTNIKEDRMIITIIGVIGLLIMIIAGIYQLAQALQELVRKWHND